MHKVRFGIGLVTNTDTEVNHPHNINTDTEVNHPHNINIDTEVNHPTISIQIPR